MPFLNFEHPFEANKESHDRKSKAILLSALGGCGLALGGVIVKQRSEIKHLRKLAYEDEKTRLPNLRAMEREVKKLQKHKRIFVCAHGDYVSFKDVNDNISHAYGDDVLRTPSRIKGVVRDTDTVAYIGNQIPENDYVARTGGDEFAYLFDITEEVKIADRRGRLRTLTPDEKAQAAVLRIAHEIENDPYVAEYNQRQIPGARPLGVRFGYMIHTPDMPTSTADEMLSISDPKHNLFYQSPYTLE